MKKLIYILIAVLAFVKVTKAQTELVSTGTGTAYELSYPAAFSYSAGITITFKAHAASTAGPVTLNINTLGARTIKKNVTADLALGDIMLNQYVTVIYDGTNFQLTSSLPASANGWGLSGNAGTTVASNYIGTSDAVDLVIRTNATEKARFLTNGNVGIGTATPNALLSLHNATNSQLRLSTTSLGTLTSDGLLLDLNNTAASINLYENLPLHFATNGSNKMTLTGNGDLGLGTTNPSTKFHLRGVGIATALLQNADNITGKNVNIAQLNFSDAQTTNPQATIEIKRDEVSSNASDLPTAITFSTVKDGNDASLIVERMRINSGGWVGIGTTVPQDMLSVGTSSQFMVGDNGEIKRIKGLNYTWPNAHTVGVLQNDGTGILSFGALPTGANAWTKSGNNIYQTTLTDLVGIGTTSPGKIAGVSRYLTLAQGDAYNSQNVSLELQGSTATGINGNVSRIDYINYNGSINHLARIEARTGSASNNGRLVFSTHDGTSLNERMKIMHDGKVGIGLGTGTNPTAQLDINVDGAISGVKYGIISTVNGTVADASSIYGNQITLLPNGTGAAYGINSSISAIGTGLRTGFNNSVTSSATSSSTIYGINNSVNSGYNAGFSQTYGMQNMVTVAAGNTGPSFGVYTSSNHQGSGSATGYYNDFFTNGTGSRIGFQNSIITAATNTGNLTGFSNYISNSATAGGGTVKGITNQLSNTAGSTGVLTGLENTISVGNNASSYAILNTFTSSGGNGSRFGMYNSIGNAVASTGNLYGVYNYFYQNGTSTTYGVYNDLSNTTSTSGMQYGEFTDVRANASNTSNQFGNFIIMSGSNATGTKYGVYVTGEDVDHFSGNVGIGTNAPGTSKLYIDIPTTDAVNPTALTIDNGYTGASSKTGLDLNVSVGGSGIKYGIKSVVDGLTGSASAIYGNQLVMSPNGTGTVYGFYANINGVGTGTRYGFYNNVAAEATSTSTIYGIRNILSGASATKYGIYNQGEDRNYFSGIVGIGNTTSLEKLVVEHSATVAAARFQNLANATTATGVVIRAGSSTVAGANMITFFRSDGTTIGAVDQNSATSVQYLTTSDRNLKNLYGETKYGLSDLMKIKIYDYSYKDDKNKTKMTGFVAQELYETFPQSVAPPGEKKDDNGNAMPWMVDYGSVTPLLVKSIQDQQKLIEDLQKQIDLLKQQINAQENK